jgi:O-antigen ligase
MAAFVMSALVSVMLSWLGVKVPLPSTVAEGGLKDRLLGIDGDPNELAANLVPALVFALALLVTVRDALLKSAVTGAIAVLTAALFATQSRGGLVAVAVTGVAAVLLYGVNRRHALMAIVGVALVAAAVFVVSPGASSRVTSFGDQGQGRLTFWTLAWRVAGDRPLVGVGLGNYPEAARAYVRRPGALRFVEKVIDHRRVVHNSYLELLAETGVIGLGLYLAVVAGCLGAAQRAARLFERAGRSDLARLARAVLIASIGYLTTSLTLSNATNRRLWLVLALGPAVLAMAGHLTARRSGAGEHELTRT